MMFTWNCYENVNEIENIFELLRQEGTYLFNIILATGRFTKVDSDLYLCGEFDFWISSQKDISCIFLVCLPKYY